MQIEDTKIILENLLQTSQPQSVIVFSNIIDFYNDTESRYNGKDLKNYMDGCSWNDITIVSKYGFPHNIKTIQTHKGYIVDRKKYTSLDFDSKGGVALEVYDEDIDSTRWDLLLEEDKVKEEQYTALEELCQLANAEGIDLYFVQTPYRGHYLSVSGPEEMEEHQKRCREILESYGQYYWSTEELEKYDDSLFADYIHLNKEGSYLFTKEFMRYFVACEQNKDM